MIVSASETTKGDAILSKNIGKCPSCGEDGLDAASVVANVMEEHDLITCEASVEGVLSETDRLRRTLMAVTTCSSCEQDVSVVFCPNGEIYTEKIDLGD